MTESIPSNIWFRTYSIVWKSRSFRFFFLFPRKNKDTSLLVLGGEDFFTAELSENLLSIKKTCWMPWGWVGHQVCRFGPGNTDVRFSAFWGIAYKDKYSKCVLSQMSSSIVYAVWRRYMMRKLGGLGAVVMSGESKQLLLPGIVVFFWLLMQCVKTGL